MKGFKFVVGMSWALSVVFAGAAGRMWQNADVIRSALGAKAAAATKDGTTAIAGKDGWLFLVTELHYLSAGPFWGDNAAKVSKSSSPQYADPLPAILDFKSQLDAMGVDLLIVPVPAKAAIYPDMLVDGAKADVSNRVDQAQADFIKTLNDKGVHTLDLTPAYLQYRADHPDAPLYSKTDTHWSGTGIDVASDLIAAEVKKESWYGGVAKTNFTTAPSTVTAKGDLVDMLKTGAPGAETFKLKSVNQGGAPIKLDAPSPLLILGDSHSLIYSIGGDMLASGSGFPENLAAKVGFTPEVFGVKGSGATQVRRSFRQMGKSMEGKKMVIWVFTAREFTESEGGWRIVPMK